MTPSDVHPDAPSAVRSIMSQATLIDFPGKPAALLFTSGCNFRCGFCHNFRTLGDTGAKTYTLGELETRLVRDFKKAQWVEAVTLTGGEPTLRPELKDTVALIKQLGFSLKLDTNGSNPDRLAELLPCLDYIAMDLKGPLDRYPEIAHFNDIDSIRKSIRIIMNAGIPYEFRTTFVETYFSPEDWKDMGKTVLGAETYAIQAFIPHDNLPDPALCLQPRTRPAALRDAEQILKGYVRNVLVRGA